MPLLALLNLSTDYINQRVICKHGLELLLRVRARPRSHVERGRSRDVAANSQRRPGRVRDNGGYR